MRLKTQSGNVVSSHSSAWGVSSRSTKLRIESRSASCSSLKMKCLRLAAKSGLRTASAADMEVDSRTSHFPQQAGARPGGACPTPGRGVPHLHSPDCPLQRSGPEADDDVMHAPRPDTAAKPNALGAVLALRN